MAQVISLDLNSRRPIAGSPLHGVVMAGIDEAVILGGGLRIDSADGASHTVALPGALDRLRKIRLDAIAGKMSKHRNDALASNTNSFPRDFEHIYAETLREKRKPLNWQRLFPVDTRVPLGARTHTVRRVLGTGDAVVTRTGSDLPVMGQQRIEERFGVAHIACAVEVNWFDMISDNFEGRNRFQDDTEMAIRAIDERINDVAFNGYVPMNMPGMLTYPQLPISVSPEVWSAGTGGSPAADIRRDLNIGANFAGETSGEAFSPNRLVTSIRLRNFLMQTQNSVATDRSIASVRLEGQSEITEIEGAHELRGIGPNGEDGLFFYREEPVAASFVMIQAPTAMPVFQSDSFHSQVVYIATIGGTIMRDVGHNHLRLASLT